MAADPDALAPRPEIGRVFEGARKVRLGDVDTSGRLRLDAAVRYLQDLSADDTADVALPDAEAWVVRKTVLEVHRFPRYLEPMALATWCSGIGSHYAERRVSLLGERGGRIEGATTWVCVDMASGRPRRIPDGFEAIYGEASGGRRIKARLVHPAPGPEVRHAPWPVRRTDLDVLDHVNNAAYWSAVEEARFEEAPLALPFRAELEHHRALEFGEAAARVVSVADGRLAVWLVVGTTVTASAQLRVLTPPG